MPATGATNVAELVPRRIPRFRWNGAAQARAALIRRKTKLIYGGYGSGKSATTPLHYIREAQSGDVSQQHGLFTNTIAQFKDGVLPELEKWLKVAGMARDGKVLEWDREPPLSWFRYWEKAKIEIPSCKKYRGILTLPCGIHIVIGTLHNQGYRQFQSVAFRTIVIEEVFNCSVDAVRVMLPRSRCGDASPEGNYLELDLIDSIESLDAMFEPRQDAEDDDLPPLPDDDEDPACGHLHENILIGNPPLGRHWIYEWLDRREEAAKKYYVLDGASEAEEVNHREWDLLHLGVGNMIAICVPTYDNVENVGPEYVEELEDAFSNDVAERLIAGRLKREAAGRAFDEYSSARNVSPVPYDLERALHVWLDFDLAPRAATFAHVLERGEYPDQGERDQGIVHYGVFGEYFHESEQSNRDFILALIRGGRGIGGDCTYPNPKLRGLPASWDGLRSHRGHIYFSGDARGKDKSRHSNDLSSDWKMVQDIVGQELGSNASYSFELPSANPTPAIGIHGLNSKFCNVAGVRSVHFDPITLLLQRDAEVCEWDEEGHDLLHYGRGFGGGSLWMRTHLIKSVIYGVSQYSPMGNDRTGISDVETMMERSFRKARRHTYPLRSR